LVAATNPCPCGYWNDALRVCRCDDHRRELYRQKLSGPLLDRIDLHLSVPRLSRAELMGEERGEGSDPIRERVREARDRQRRRYTPLGLTCNAHLPGPLARRQVILAPEAQDLLGGAVERFALTGRGFDRALKVARTIADLHGADLVGAEHVAEALSYRSKPDEDELARAV
jgi:magnesium chelatase family protein